MARPAASASGPWPLGLAFEALPASRDGARRYRPRRPRSIRAPAVGRPRNGTGCRRWRGRCGMPGSRRPHCWPAARRRSGSEKVSSCHWKIGKVSGSAPSTGIGLAPSRVSATACQPNSLAPPIWFVPPKARAMIWLPRQMPSTARSCRSKSRSKFEKLRKIGIVVVGQRVLAAAEHDRSVMAVGVVRQALRRDARGEYRSRRRLRRVPCRPGRGRYCRSSGRRGRATAIS